jgi:hypothetical protein
VLPLPSNPNDNKQSMQFLENTFGRIFDSSYKKGELQMIKLSPADRIFLAKLRRDKNVYISIQNAYKAGLLTLEDKKRCCVIGNGFPLESFANLHIFGIKNDVALMKHQWFHSAASIYTLLSRPRLITQNNAAVLLLPTKETFLALSRHVLSTDEDGIEFLAQMDAASEVDIGKDCVVTWHKRGDTTAEQNEAQ